MNARAWWSPSWPLPLWYSGGGLLVGSVLAGEDREHETTLEQRLARAHQRQRDHNEQLARAQADNERLNRQLTERRRAARRQARAARELRGELDGAQRALQRARAQ